MCLNVRAGPAPDPGDARLALSLRTMHCPLMQQMVLILAPQRTTQGFIYHGDPQQNQWLATPRISTTATPRCPDLSTILDVFQSRSHPRSHARMLPHDTLRHSTLYTCWDPARVHSFTHSPPPGPLTHHHHPLAFSLLLPPFHLSARLPPTLSPHSSLSHPVPHLSAYVSAPTTLLRRVRRRRTHSRV